MMKSSITRQISALLLIPAIGALVAAGLFYWYLSVTATDTAFVNIAGRQRLLAQQLQEYAHMVAGMGQEDDRPTLRQLIDRFDRTLHILQHGGRVEQHLLQPAPEIVQAVLADTLQLWEAHRAAFDRIAETGYKHPDSRRAWDYLQSQGSALTDAADHIVATYSEHSLRLRRYMLFALVFIALLDLLLLAGAIIVIRRYVTERRLTEETLRESERRYRNLVNIIPHGVAEIDLKGRFTYNNTAHSRMMGYEPQDLMGMSFFDLATEEEEARRTREYLARMIETRPAPRPYLTQNVTRSGRVITIQVDWDYQFDEHGRLTGFISIITDVTAQQRMERALRQLAEGSREHLGADILAGLARLAADVLGAEYALIAELHPDKPGHARTLAVCAEGKIVDNFEYDLAHTPCDDVIGGELCCHPEHVRQQFPKDQLLVEMGVESYLGIPLYDSAGETMGLMAVLDRKPLVDIESVKSLFQILARRAANELERMRADTWMVKLSSTVEQSADLVAITDPEGIIEYVNPSFEKTTGYSKAELVGKKPMVLKSGKQHKAFYQRLWRTIQGGEPFHDVFVNRCKDGSLYYEEKTITPIKDAQGRIINFVATGKDITERRENQERLRHMAYYDALTGLPNRLLLSDRINQSLSRTRWNKRLLAVMYLDLDRFKIINDTLSHEIGDKLLEIVAQRLSQSVREGDTVARVSGDKFALMLNDVAAEYDIPHVAHTVLMAMAEPFQIDGRELFLTASIGISQYPADGDNAQTLIKHAEIAMYRAKEQGRNNYQLYLPAMNAKALERLALENSLRYALEREQFLLHYQPKVGLATGQITGMEALIRWQHPESGMVSPVDFIPLLEETGLIVPVGEWVLYTACRQAVAWQQAGLPPMEIAVNLSARQFKEDDLVHTVTRVLADTGLDPRWLTLEITESILMRQAGTTLDVLNELDAMGVRLAIDDFGTGYSSLSYLKRFPVHTLKIDRSFIKDIPNESDDMAIVEAVIVMAHSLKLGVIAEGVETQEQLAFLRARDCEAIQGFYFSRPLPTTEFDALLRAGTTWDENGEIITPELPKQSAQGGD